MTRLSLPALILLVFLRAPVRGQDPFAAKVKPFVETYCSTCHGAGVQKAGLRLDTLGTDLADEANLARWVQVHDKVAAGKMPPRKSEQPPRDEAAAFTKRLHEQLHAASLARQQTKGRVLLRRLNSTEYENTIRELVGTNVRVKELLPEANSVAGFDNVSSALDVSATHLLLYQEAAEKAVLSAVPAYPHYPIKERRTGKDMLARGPNLQQALGRSARLDGDSVIVYSKLGR